MREGQLGHLWKKPVFYIKWENEYDRVYKFIKKGTDKYYVLRKEDGEVHPRRVRYDCKSTMEAIMFGNEITEEEYLNYQPPTY